MIDICETVRNFLLDELASNSDGLTLTNDTRLKESGILDSLSTVKLVSFLEEHFQLEFEADDLVPERFVSINTVEHLVRSKLGTRL